MIRYPSAFGLLLAVLVALLCLDITDPWNGHHEGWGACYGHMARNSVKYGYGETGFGSVVNGGPRPEGPFRYYLHHPPLLPLFLSASIRVFGVHEWNLRLVPILFTAGALCVFWRIGRKLWDERRALLATACMALLPMTHYYGKVVQHEPVALFFQLTMFLFYLRWSERGSRWDFAGMLFAQALACGTNWAGYFMAPLLFLHHRLSKREWKWSLLIPVALNFLLFGFFLLHVFLLSGREGLQDLFSVFLKRSSLPGSSQPELHRFTLSAWAGRQVRWTGLYFTVSILVLSLLWAGHTIRGRQRQDGCLGAFWLTVGAAYVLLFSDASFVHDYWLYFFIPVLAIAGGGGLALLQGTAIKRALAMLLVAGLLFQSGWICLQRHRERRGYPVELAYSTSVAQHTASPDRIATSLRVIPWYVLYYADRDMILAVDTLGHFQERQAARPTRYFITTTSELLISRVPHLRGAGQEFFDRSGVLHSDHILYRYLCEKYRFEVRDGFVFFDLSERR